MKQNNNSRKNITWKSSSSLNSNGNNNNTTTQESWHEHGDWKNTLHQHEKAFTKKHHHWKHGVKCMAFRNSSTRNDMARTHCMKRHDMKKHGVNKHGVRKTCHDWPQIHEQHLFYATKQMITEIIAWRNIAFKRPGMKSDTACKNMEWKKHCVKNMSWKYVCNSIIFFQKILYPKPGQKTQRT